jgi:hypothetical protein
MRGSQIKKIKKWCIESWNATSPEEKEKFGTLELFINRITDECKKNPDAKKFVAWSLKEHFTPKEN